MIAAIKGILGQRNLWGQTFFQQEWAMAWCCLFFILASILDTVCTIYGLKHQVSTEANHVYVLYMDHFGQTAGPIFFKAVMVILAICGIKIVDVGWARQKKRLPERRVFLSFIFFSGGVYYTYAMLIWLVLEIKNHL